MTKYSTLLGDYASTHALRAGELSSESFAFDFDPAVLPSSAFKRAIRTKVFDIAEIAVVTFIMAREGGLDMSLLPAVIFARFPHFYLKQRSDLTRIDPADLAGRSIAIRSYSVTTVAMIADVLEKDFGIDPLSITWIACEDPHVEGFVDPPNVRRVEGLSPVDAVFNGLADAAILGDRMQDDRLCPIFQDIGALQSRWLRRSGGVLPINHLIMVRNDLPRDHAASLMKLLIYSKEAAALTADQAVFFPMGMKAVRPGLEFMLDLTYRSGLTKRRLSITELFNDVTGGLDT